MKEYKFIVMIQSTLFVQLFFVTLEQVCAVSEYRKNFGFSFVGF